MCLVLHKYSKWVTFEKGEIRRTNDGTFNDSFVIGNYLRQKRTCEVCGKEQLRTERTKL